MKTKGLTSWIKTYGLVTIISVCFVVSLSYIIHIILEHKHMFARVHEDPHIHNDWEVFLYVTYIMAGSGFLMMVTVMGSLVNISRLHEDATGLCATLSKQMAAVETSKDGIAILDAKGIFTYMNQAHARCYGYAAPDDLIGKSWKNLYDDERKVRFEREIFPLLKKEGWWSGNSQGTKNDGELFPQEVSLNTLEDGGLICIVRDVSEKVKNENLLKLIKLAVEAAEDGIAIADANNKLLFMNRSYLRINGRDAFQREDFIGTDWRHLYNAAGQREINSIVLPTTILKGSWTGTIKVMRPDKVLFYADSSLTKLKDGLILGVMRDVTARKTAELEKEVLREQLFQSQKMEAINRLSEGITSDFSEMISFIQQCAGLLAQDPGVKGNTKNLIDDIGRTSAQARDLVDQLLGFSHKKNIKAGLVDIAANIKNKKFQMPDQLPDNIECVIDVKVHDAYIYAVSEQLDQILNNLCRNAEDALKDKRGKIAISLKEADRNPFGLQRHIMVDDVQDRAYAAQVRVKREAEKMFLMSGFLLKGRNYLQVSVCDNGPGISEEALPNIFDPFFTTKIGGSSAGLGLSMVHGTMISANGAIIVETIAGEGTTVHLFFPRTNVLEYRDSETLQHAV